MSPHLLVWVPHYLLDVLCVMVEDTGTLILLPLFHHWIGRDGEREGGREVVDERGSRCNKFHTSSVFAQRVSDSANGIVLHRGTNTQMVKCSYIGHACVVYTGHPHRYRSPHSKIKDWSS